MQGSNTVGARMAPNWAKVWLEQKGVTHVQVQSLAAQNEYRVVGRNVAQPVYIDIYAHGSSTGFKGLQQSTADIALSSRDIKAQEVRSLQSRGDMRSFSSENVVAIDGLAIIVNSRNSINSLSVSEISQIFSGEITNWLEVSGVDRPISVYARDDQSGTWDTFKNLVLAKKYTLSTNAQRFESNDALSAAVTADLGGIGFVGLASVRNAKALAVGDQKTTPLKPEPLYVATEDYPLSRRLYMYIPEQTENSYVREFMSFVHSQPGQNIVENIGFISQNPIKLRVKEQNGPDEYQQLSRHAERLSINFRFKPGDSKLDNKAQQDILRVGTFLRTHNTANLKIQLVGFSDSKASDQRAEVLSRLRASAVKIALFRMGISSESVLGYGSEMLVANDGGNNGTKNDRVEVWLYANSSKRGDQAVVNSN